MSPANIACASSTINRRPRKSSASSENRDDPFVLIGQQKMDPWDVHPGKRSYSHSEPFSNQITTLTPHNFHFTQATFASALRQKPFKPMRVRKGDGEKLRSSASPNRTNTFFSPTSPKSEGVREEATSRKSTLNLKGGDSEKDEHYLTIACPKALRSKCGALKKEEGEKEGNLVSKQLVMINTSCDCEKDQPCHHLQTFTEKRKEADTSYNTNKVDSMSSKKAPVITPANNLSNQTSFSSPSSSSHTCSSKSLPDQLLSPSPQKLTATTRFSQSENVNLTEQVWSPLEAETPIFTNPHTRSTTCSSYSEPEPMIAPIPTIPSPLRLDFGIYDGPLLPSVDTTSLVVSMEKELSQARQHELQAVQQSLSLKEKVHELKLQNQQLSDHVAWLNSRLCEEREERVKAQVELASTEVKWKKSIKEYQGLKEEVQTYRLLRSKLDRELKMISPVTTASDILLNRSPSLVSNLDTE